MSKCHICASPIVAFMSFGEMPIANGFLKPGHQHEEYFFEMEVGHCIRCNAVQLLNQPEKEKMFHDEYPFFSGTSKGMELHFADFAKSVKNIYLAQRHNPFVVEIGCNDGILLQHFPLPEYRHLGIDPSANVAKVAQSKGLKVEVAFFNKNKAEQIVETRGHADVFLAANVMCHLSDINSIVEGIKTLLKPDGVVVFEEPYLGTVIETTAYDQIYDEHVFLFSVQSVGYLFEQFDMEIIDVEFQSTHGGSMRYTVAHRDVHEISGRVKAQEQIEADLRLSDPHTYQQFKISCERSRDNLVSLLSEIASEGKRMVGYAATSKSTTVLNYCRISTELLPQIVDTTPIKHGRLSPGMHVPIRPYEEFSRLNPDYALLFAYNHKKEILGKEAQFSTNGGKWVLYVPEVHTL